MKSTYQKMTFQGQKFYNKVAIGALLIANIIILCFVLDTNTESDFSEYSSTFFYEKTTTNVAVTEEKEETKLVKPIKPSTTETKTIKVKNVVKIATTTPTPVVVKNQTITTPEIVKVTRPVKKIVTRKRKIEFVQMNSKPALSVSNSLLSVNNSLVLDTFVKHNEIITKAIEIIDSVEVTNNDTVTVDSTYYVVENKTIAKKEEPTKKIVPIKSNGQKINWVKKDTTNKIVVHTQKFVCLKADTINKIIHTRKGTWVYYKDKDITNGQEKEIVTENYLHNFHTIPKHNMDIQYGSPDINQASQKIAPFQWDNINILFPLLE
jgi:hypothetical protein